MVIGCVCKYGDVFSLAVLIDRGLDQQNSTRRSEDQGQRTARCAGGCKVQAYLEAHRTVIEIFVQFSGYSLKKKLVSMAMRVHPFPYRTRKLSSFAPTILGWKRPGKIGRCQHKRPLSIDSGLFLCTFRTNKPPAMPGDKNIFRYKKK